MVSYGTGLKIYKNSPPFIKQCINSFLYPIPRSILLGNGFRDKFNFLLETDTWSFKDLVKLQEKYLKNLILHAYSHCPYYKGVFTQANLHPTDIKKIEDIKKIPLLTKEDIKNNFSDIVSSNYTIFKPGFAHTSGSTGEPLEFYLDQQNREMEYASVWRQCYWGEIKNVNVKVATFRGDFVFDFEKTEKISRWEGISKERIFNTYKLNRDKCKMIVQELNKFKPIIIKGYPHSLYILSRFINEEGYILKFKPTLIQTSSEQLSLHMRETIEYTFNCKIMDWYGQSEYVLSIGQCAYGTYHQTMETGIMDYVDDNWGYERLIGTGLWNYSMPFINYNIGDLIHIGTKKDCPCGRNHFTIHSFEGRINDMLCTPDGRIISGVGVDHYWKHRVIPALTSIPEYIHFIQESRKKLLIQIYSSNEMSENDLSEISNSIHFLTGDEMDIKITLLDKLPTSKKWKLMDSKINIDDVL